MKKLITFGLLFFILFYIMISKNIDIFFYEEYEHLVEINRLKEINLNITDSLNYYIPNIIIAKFPNPFTIIKILPLIFFILNIILLEQIFIQIKKRYYSTLFIILSPSFLYLHFTYNKIFISLFFYFLSIYLLLKDKYSFSLITSIICLALNPYFFYILIISFSGIFYLIHKKNILSIFIIFISTYLFTISKNPESSIIISDFGSFFGISIFLIILGIMGLIFSWKEKNYLIYTIIISLYIASLYEKFIVIFLNFIFAYHSAIAFEKIKNRKWEIDLLKNYVILLILCGLLFSSFSFINILNRSIPSGDEIISLKWLQKYNTEKYTKENIKKGVLSNYEYGFAIKYYGLEPYTDLNYYYYSTKIKINETNNIFKSRNLKEILEFMKKNNIKYIWINQKMKKQIWEKDEEGILLLLKTSKYFKKIFNYGNVDIWEITIL